MPIYVAECGPCNRRLDYVRKVADRNDTPMCECGHRMQKIITPTHVQPDLPEYESPIDGRIIRGRRARRYDLERSGSRPYEGLDAEQREAAKRRAENEKRIERQLDESLGHTITDLDASNRLTRVSDRNDPLPDTTGLRTY